MLWEFSFCAIDFPTTLVLMSAHGLYFILKTFEQINYINSPSTLDMGNLFI
jgi:hypothetical protein